MLDLVKAFFLSNVGQSLSIAAILAIASQLFTARGKLAWAVSHQHAYQMPNPAGSGGSFLVRTQEIWIQNVGRAAIDAVEITLNYSPQHYEVWSPRKYTTESIANDRLVLTFPSLAGREFFRISMIETRNLEIPSVLSVRWSNGQGKALPMAPVRVYSKPVQILVGLLILLGSTVVVYALLQAAIRIYNISP